VSIATRIEQPLTIEADPSLFRQVLNNLLSNAIKYNKKDGTVTVELKKGRLSIADTGIGMAKDQIPHIFDRFYQADDSRSRGGFGLGLALVKKIADVHGWDLDVKSVEGEGSSFSITFAGTSRSKQKVS